jgi:pimeloyl-ACP methyl ester carboxylesterase
MVGRRVCAGGLGRRRAVLAIVALVVCAILPSSITGTAWARSAARAAGLVPGGPVGGPPLDPARQASPHGHFYDWRGTPSDVSNAIQYGRGEIIVTGRPFADHGAETDPLGKDPTDYVNGSTACGLPVPCFGQGGNSKDGYVPSEYGGSGVDGGAVGGYRYPSGTTYANDAADIVETRVAVGKEAWYLLVRLNTLNDPVLTAVEAEIDWRHVLLVHGQEATFDGHPVQAVGDPAQALFEVRIPFSVYDPGSGVHQVFVAAGLWNPPANTWYYPATGEQVALANAEGATPGEGPSAESPFFDLAYDPTEGMGSYWRDAQQAADIASGNFTDDAFPVDFGALEHGGCPAAGCYRGPTVGLFSRVFRSGQPLGRGVALQTRYGQNTGTYTRNEYLSPYQPYAIYVPHHQTGALVLLLHPLGGSYMTYSITSMPALADWAEKLGVIVAMPEARGEGGWYEGEAEKDVFEVWRDVAEHYRIDPNRVYLTGMSMGGYGTWRLAQLYPDLFARAIVWSGLMTPSGGTLNLEDLFGNTSNVPLLVVHGVLDPLVPVTGPEQWMPQYAAVGDGTYRYLLYLDRTHETTYPGTTEPWVLSWLHGLPARQTNPVRVTYRIERSLFQPQFGITYSHAYWATGLTLAPGADSGSIDATRSTATASTTVLPTSYGADTLGPYRLEGGDVTPGPPTPNYVDAQLTGLSSAVLDTRRMGWSQAAPQRIVGMTTEPITLTLSGDYAGGVQVTGAGSFTVAGGAVTLQLPAGPFAVTVVTPAAAAARVRPAPRRAGSR